MFNIKDGYQENPGPVYFLDDVTSDRGIVFQPDVYTMAEMLVMIDPVAESLKVALGRPPGIVDVGCGWGDKLAAMHDRHPEWTFCGIDYGANIAHCRATYGWGAWSDVDLEGLFVLPTGTVVIASDVIEHLVDPRKMIQSIVAAEPEFVVLSTPERDVQYGYDHMGPSQNLCHVREWNAEELHGFLESEGLTILHHGLTRGSDQGWAMATQLVVCK